jgi:hypothetical protein
MLSRLSPLWVAPPALVGPGERVELRAVLENECFDQTADLGGQLVDVHVGEISAAALRGLIARSR